jgi:hypothetical protein
MRLRYIAKQTTFSTFSSVPPDFSALRILLIYSTENVFLKRNISSKGFVFSATISIIYRQGQIVGITNHFSYKKSYSHHIFIP